MSTPGRARPVWLAMFISGLVWRTLLGQTEVHAQHVTLSLIPQFSILGPNTATSVALRLEIEPGWHIYFAHPGQSGIPTRIEWQLPQGVTVDSLRWPVPERVVTEGLISHVYSGHAVLFTTIHLRQPRGPIAIGASVTFGACQTQCLEGKAELRLTLPVGAAIVNPGWQQVTADYFALPTQITGLSARAVRRHGMLELWLTPPRAVPPATGPLTFFPIDPAVLDTCVSRIPEVSTQLVAIPLGKPNPGGTRLRGILTGWAGRALRLDVAIETVVSGER